MSKTKGTVSGVGKGKFSYFVTLAERDGFYFNTKYEPKCSKGDVVGIEYTEKGENRGNIAKLVVLDKGHGTPEPTPQKGGGGYSGDRQDSIVWQSSRKDALVLVGLLIQTETAKIPKGDKGRVVLETLVDELTVRYANDATDPKASQAYKLNSGLKEDAEVPQEDEDDPWAEPEAEGKSDSWDDSWD